MELQKGQKIKIQDLTTSTQLELKAGVSFPSGAVDITCFGVDSQDKLSDDRYFVFYNQTSTPEQAVTMKQNADGASFLIQLSKLPAFIKKLVVTIAADGDAAMQNLKDSRLSLCVGQQVLAAYSFNGAGFSQEKAVILCELYEKDGIWRLSVVSSGFNGGLSALLAHFGGTEAQPEEPAPAKAPAPPKAPAPSKTPVPPVVPVSKQEPSSQPSQPVSLKKRGDSHKISLDKNSKEILANLNWNTDFGVKTKLFGMKKSGGIDLDLACMYRLKSGHMGVIQALGNSFGAANQEPFILLDKDDRTGSSTSGETMWFKKPELIEFAIIFAYIYEGTPNWQNTGASVTLKQQGSQDISIFIDNADKSNRFCVIASLKANENQLEVKREEQFFTDHQAVDRYYGFGFRWKAGRK